MATKKVAVNIAEYDKRRAALAERMSKRPYGSQSAVAFDVRIAPTLISSVLGGKYINSRVLDAIEGWLDEREPALA